MCCAWEVEQIDLYELEYKYLTVLRNLKLFYLVNIYFNIIVTSQIPTQGKTETIQLKHIAYNVCDLSYCNC